MAMTRRPDPSRRSAPSPWRGLPAAIALAALLLAGAAEAQQADFPSRPVRLVVPYPPGGSTDVISRNVAEAAAKFLGQPVVVENRAGAGTLVGTQAGRNYPADGYTVMFQADGILSNVLGYKEPGYAVEDFTPVVVLANAVFFMMVPATLPVTTLADFVKHAKANPGKLNYGILGRGSLSHVVAYRIGQAAGLEWTEVPYKGSVEVSTAVMNSEVETYMAADPTALAMLRTGKVKLLAATTAHRSSVLPDIPTFRELGYPMIDRGSFYALFARSEVPAAALEKLRAAFGKAIETPEFKARREKQGMAPYVGTLQDFIGDMKRTNAKLVEDFKDLRVEKQ
jgi:tripartite-type tricarboxylate transporter receptor subunit TctC